MLAPAVGASRSVSAAMGTHHLPAGELVILHAPAPKRSPSTAWGRRVLVRTRIPVIVLFALVGALLAVRRAESPYADTDILWGARSGLDILSGRGLPRADSYSWTMQGSSWTPNAWGWNVLLGTAYRAGGYVGIAILGIGVMAGIGAVLGVAIRRAGAVPAWGLLVTQLALGVFALFMYPRAQLADYLAVLAIPLLLARALSAGGPKRTWRAGAALVALQVVWMNLHTTALLGPVIVAVSGGGWLLARRSRNRLPRLALLVVACGTGCLATPYGLAPLLHAKQVRDASVGLISEWRPAGFGSTEQILAVVAIAVGIVAALICWRWRAYETVGLLVLFVVMTSSALRFAPLVVLTAIPPIASAAGRIRARRIFVSRVCALAVAILAAASIAGTGHFAQPGESNISSDLVSLLPRGCRLVNDMAVGGAVILQRPDVPVFIDSRNDMYGRPFELTALAVLGDATYGERYVRDHAVTCVLAPRDAPLVRALSGMSSWRVLGADRYRLLLVR